MKTETTMQLGMIGLGRMGANMVRRLLKGGHRCVVFDRSPQAVDGSGQGEGRGRRFAGRFRRETRKAARDLADGPGRRGGQVHRRFGAACWKRAIFSLTAVIPITWTTSAAPKNWPRKGIHYVDVGTSGGVWGLERGYCMMIGGEKEVVRRLDPIFATLAPGVGDIPRTPGREKLGGTAEQGYLHCGPNGAGHFVKMVHNGIEYGIMAAYAEGLGVLKAANVGKKQTEADAETTPLRDPEHYQFDLNLADVAEVWRRGSVIASWLLDLTASALAADPKLAKFAGRVSDSGEGRWTIKAAIDEGVPVPVLTHGACTSGLPRAARRITRTNCFRPCGLVSAGTWRKAAKRRPAMNGTAMTGI